MNKVTKIEHKEFSYFEALHDSFIINICIQKYLSTPMQLYMLTLINYSFGASLILLMIHNRKCCPNNSNSMRIKKIIIIIVIQLVRNANVTLKSK